MTTATKDLISAAGIDVRFLIDEEDSGGTTTAFLCRVAPGAHTPPPHRHDTWDETVYVTAGVMTYVVNDTTHHLSQGDAICVRRGQVHEFANHGDIDAAMLVVSTPGLFREEYFRSIAEILNAATAGPPDHAALEAVQARHGVITAGP